MKNSKEYKMSIRLDDTSKSIVDAAANAGIAKTDFINRAIHEANLSSQASRRAVQPHLARLQSLLELCSDSETRDQMRKELQQVCLYLKS